LLICWRETWWSDSRRTNEGRKKHSKACWHSSLYRIVQSQLHQNRKPQHYASKTSILSLQLYLLLHSIDARTCLPRPLSYQNVSTILHTHEVSAHPGPNTNKQFIRLLRVERYEMLSKPQICVERGQYVLEGRKCDCRKQHWKQSQSSHRMTLVYILLPERTVLKC
jgi:hypothetical protein